MHLDERLRRAFQGRFTDIDAVSTKRDLHEVLTTGRRRRRNRRLALISTVAVITMGAVLLGPKVLDLLRGTAEQTPATPNRSVGVRGVITTIAGSGAVGSEGDGGPATQASIQYPFDLVVDGDGNLFILEHARRVRRVDGSGRITTVVGPPTTDDPGTITEANELQLGKDTNALAIDAEGNLYVGGGDGTHNVVNRIGASGEVTRIAGTGASGSSGDGGPATEADLGWIYDLAVDPAGNVYLSDVENHRIRMVDADGIITTIAGTGAPGWTGDGGLATDATIDGPTGLALDASGNLYFTQAPGIVRRVDGSSGKITTIAGSGKVGYAGDGGPATAARMNAPEHVAVDAEGNVFIEDTGNNCIRVVDTFGVIRTVVGMRGSGFSGDGGPAAEARLSEPSGMVLTLDGVLYIADSGNNRIRRVVL